MGVAITTQQLSLESSKLGQAWLQNMWSFILLPYLVIKYTKWPFKKITTILWKILCYSFFLQTCQNWCTSSHRRVYGVLETGCYCSASVLTLKFRVFESFKVTRTSIFSNESNDQSISHDVCLELRFWKEALVQLLVYTQLRLSMVK